MKTVLLVFSAVEVDKEETNISGQAAENVQIWEEFQLDLLEKDRGDAWRHWSGKY